MKKSHWTRPTQPAMPASAAGVQPNARERVRLAVLSGHRLHPRDLARPGNELEDNKDDAIEDEIEDLLLDPDSQVRASALGAAQRLGMLQVARLGAFFSDPDASVRRRACEIAGYEVGRRFPVGDLLGFLLTALDDTDPLVAETAAWALGEAGEAAGEKAVAALCRVASHSDPLCREAAVAALGAIGLTSGLDAIIVALKDKPAVRRRAAVALAAFDEPIATEALNECLLDRDWQVRQIAETLLGPDRLGASVVVDE